MHPTQYESKLILNEIPFGSHAAIAQDIDQSPAAISRKFNLNDELANEVGKAKRLLDSLRVHAPKQYSQVVAWLMAVDEEQQRPKFDTGTLVGRLAKETTDVVCASVQRKGEVRSFKELREAEIALTDYAHHLRNKLRLRRAS